MLALNSTQLIVTLLSGLLMVSGAALVLADTPEETGDDTNNGANDRTGQNDRTDPNTRPGNDQNGRTKDDATGKERGKQDYYSDGTKRGDANTAAGNYRYKEGENGQRDNDQDMRKQKAQVEERCKNAAATSSGEFDEATFKRCVNQAMENLKPEPQTDRTKPEVDYRALQQQVQERCKLAAVSDNSDRFDETAYKRCVNQGMEKIKENYQDRDNYRQRYQNRYQGQERTQDVNLAGLGLMQQYFDYQYLTDGNNIYIIINNNCDCSCEDDWGEQDWDWESWFERWQEWQEEQGEEEEEQEEEEEEGDGLWLEVYTYGQGTYIKSYWNDRQLGGVTIEIDEVEVGTTNDYGYLYTYTAYEAGDHEVYGYWISDYGDEYEAWAEFYIEAAEEEEEEQEDPELTIDLTVYQAYGYAYFTVYYGDSRLTDANAYLGDSLLNESYSGYYYLRELEAGEYTLTATWTSEDGVSYTVTENFEIEGEDAS